MRFCGTYFLAVAVAFLPFQFRQARDLARRPRLFAVIGLSEATAFFLQFNAFLLAPVTYALAIKRLSLLVSVLYGRFLFGERHIPARAAGAVLMIAGAGLLAFA
jgi:drug/metabolite transporter (DMT)-like permease